MPDHIYKRKCYRIIIQSASEDLVYIVSYVCYSTLPIGAEKDLRIYYFYGLLLIISA